MSGKMIVFGEVLFDCFPGGESVLGGAPFNVAWHMHALGDQPLFISRVGSDEAGNRIEETMQKWGMNTSGLQRDANAPTGTVQIAIEEGEPHYDICAGVAYDFIDAATVPAATAGDTIYHGSLALRSPQSRAAWQALVESAECDLFMDVNLRDPWWQVEDIKHWLRRARWAKMNGGELRALGYQDDNMEEAIAALQADLGVAEVIVTRGKEGALVRTQDGKLHGLPPPPLDHYVDSVGAGDSFSAIYLHGTRAGWPLMKTLDAAQRFANGIIGQRGATPSERSFYTAFLEVMQHV